MFLRRVVYFSLFLNVRPDQRFDVIAFTFLPVQMCNNVRIILFRKHYRNAVRFSLWYCFVYSI